MVKVQVIQWLLLGVSAVATTSMSHRHWSAAVERRVVRYFISDCTMCQIQALVKFFIMKSYNINIAILYKKAVLSQRWPRNAPYTWVPWKFSGLPDYAHGYYSQPFSRAFVWIDPLNVPTKFEVRSFIRSSDNGGTTKIRTVPGYALAPFSPKFLIGFYSDWPYNCTAKFVVRSFTRSRDNRGYPKNFGNLWIRPRSILSKIFNGLLFEFAL